MCTSALLRAAHCCHIGLCLWPETVTRAKYKKCNFASAVFFVSTAGISALRRNQPLLANVEKKKNAARPTEGTYSSTDREPTSETESRKLVDLVSGKQLANAQQHVVSRRSMIRSSYTSEVQGSIRSNLRLTSCVAMWHTTVVEQSIEATKYKRCNPCTPCPPSRNLDSHHAELLHKLFPVEHELFRSPLGHCCSYCRLATNRGWRHCCCGVSIIRHVLCCCNAIKRVYGEKSSARSMPAPPDTRKPLLAQRRTLREENSATEVERCAPEVCSSRLEIAAPVPGRRRRRVK